MAFSYFIRKKYDLIAMHLLVFAIDQWLNSVTYVVEDKIIQAMKQRNLQ